MDNIKNVFQYIRDQPKTPIGEYAFAYDSHGKFKEPIFDGFLACIALLPNDVFNESFHYVPTEYKDTPRPSKMVSGLSTNYLEGSFTREQLPIHYNSKHVFLLGPMNQSAVEYVQSLKGNVIFHIQGDASGEKKTTSYPDAMTEHPTIFPISFNLWTGEECSRLIRSEMNASFTVKCKPDIVQEDVDVITNVGAMVDITVKIPSIYVQMRNYMVQACLCGRNFNFPLQTLNIVTIYQDMIDKDNSVSCWILLKHSSIPCLSLIGRRVYVANPVLKDYTFTFQEGKNGDIHFPAVSESNQVFDEYETRKNHHEMKSKFQALLVGLEYCYPLLSDEDIVDGIGEMSESERAPFYEPFMVKI